MPERPSRLAAVVDVIHYAVIAFWLGGFLLYPWFPRFRLAHAVFVVAAGAHQILLGNRCILTIVSQRLRGAPKDAIFISLVPKWLNTLLTWLTIAGAILTIILTLRP